VRLARPAAEVRPARPAAEVRPARPAAEVRLARFGGGAGYTAGRSWRFSWRSRHRPADGHGGAVRAGHEQVEDDEIVDFGAGPAEPVGSGIGQVGHEAFGGQGAAQGGPSRLLVVDDQDARPGYRRRRCRRLWRRI
jgi:hypothetical protein